MARIDQNNLLTKFSALKVNFSNASPDPLGLRKPAHASVKERYPWMEIDHDYLRSGTGICSRASYVH